MPIGYADVVVCGAGPVGLTAAALLAARGVDVVVLEQHTSTSNEPKAISIDDEALRVFQQAGIVDRVMPVVVPGTGTRYYDRNGVALFHARGPRPFRLGYPFKNPFAQPDLERVLADSLEAAPNVELRFGTRVIGFEQHADHVRVRAAIGGSEIALDASYVLGCDGGRSATRLLQGIEMTGRSFQDVWLVVDTLEDPHTERYAMHHGDPARPHVIVPGLDGRCRYEFRLFSGEGTPEQEPPFELIERLVARYRSITPDQVERAVNYRFNAVVADQWMIGRSFLLGDAAHMMPPFAGQGLNSGIRDAANLTWKVADVLAGRLAPTALDTYQSERYPHASATVDLSERLGRIVMTTSPRVADRRDRAVALALATDEGRTYLEEMRYRPVQRYTEGLIAATDRPELVGVPIGQPLVFDTDTHRLRRLDEVIGCGWALLAVEVDETEWEAVEPVRVSLDAVPVQVTVTDHMPRTVRRVVIDVDGDLISEFADYNARFVLVRPDRIVAAAWLPHDSADLVLRVRTWTPDTVETISPSERALSHG
ncbi:bifunctional 3-(3-hydroxy-phenyl)propionate/3-hydroxycinnamic acid hydroxylase [Nocardia pneumoniae]|uniref:bifunctional 3-(3-hydroxy-phenyl)propionate/3-hydroxycinnamic acid hydroxylase n=1 Tax=Nocardia pneumoniae TaxID=228601 RepID=UPI000593D5FB